MMRGVSTDSRFGPSKQRYCGSSTTSCSWTTADIGRATGAMIAGTRTLVEPAGSAGLAAALQLRDRLRGRRVALIASGGNLTPAQLLAALQEG